MWSKVETYIKKHKILKTNDLYLVALSGGADSVALLLLLHEHGYRVHAAHCNFRLRGDESDRDERFCVDLCERLGVPLHRVHFDTKAYAEVHHVSIEMAARELRYGWFAQLCEDIGAAGVCVAHHRDDSVETVLLNLVRGTGLRGLCGIQPISLLEMSQKNRPFVTCGESLHEHKELVVLRPLLCVSRAEIEAFLVEIGQKYVTDSTNMEADVMRNVVRLEVLPLLRSLNPAVSENIQRTAENLSAAQLFLDTVLDGYKERNELILSSVADCASRGYVVFEWLKNYGFNGAQVQQILEAETGRMVTSPMGFDVLKDRDRLLVEPSLKPMKPLKIPEEGTYILGEKDGFASENARFSVRKSLVFVSKDPHIATVDACKVQFPLTLRRVEEGDWMIPYGMNGRKLLSDLMTDRKMTLFEKRKQLVVVDNQGVVVWLVGLRIDDRVAVSDSTQEVLMLCLQ
ncbi:MAG: tRNA lysidine(34) synthetase TilS [Prevotella sp.]|nr:tRNA lysidine(34) synthetase TilS [Prevotella sp.]